MKKFLNNDRAAAALEFALVAPVFVLILMGIITFGLYLAADHAVIEAAGEGGRASVAGMTVQERIDLAQAAASAALAQHMPFSNMGNAVIKAAPASQDGLFQVSVQYYFPLPLQSFGLNNPIVYTATMSNGGY